MAKLDGAAVTKYLVLGAGAVLVPSFLGDTLTGFLDKVPFLMNPLFGAVTPAAVLMAGLGIGVVEQLFFSK